MLQISGDLKGKIDIPALWSGLKTSGSFVQNVGIISSGKLLVVLSSLVFIPILSRIYDPVAYGTFSLYNAVVTICVTVLTLGYPGSFALIKVNKQFHNLFAFLFMTVTVGTILLLVISPLVAYPMGLEDRSYLLPIGVFIGSIIMLMSNWNVRSSAFKVAAFLDGSGNLLIRIANLLIGLQFAAPTVGLIAGDVIGKGYASVINLYRFITTELHNMRRHISAHEVRVAIKEYKNYPIYILPNQLVNQFAGQIPIFILSASYGSTTLGLFSMSNSLLGIPVQIITNGISTVFLKKASDLQSQSRKTLADFTEKVMHHLLLLLLIPFSIVGVFGQEIVTFVLGGQWTDAGLFVSYMSAYYFVHIAIAPIQSIFRVLKQERMVLYFNLVRIVTTFLALYLGYVLFDSALRSIQFFSAVSLVNYFAMAFIICRLLRIRFSNLFVRYFASYLVLEGVFYFLKLFVHEFL